VFFGCFEQKIILQNKKINGLNDQSIFLSFPSFRRPFLMRKKPLNKISQHFSFFSSFRRPFSVGSSQYINSWKRKGKSVLSIQYETILKKIFKFFVHINTIGKYIFYRFHQG